MAGRTMGEHERLDKDAKRPDQILRAALERVLDEETAETLLREALESVTTSKTYAEYTCKGCNKRQRVLVEYRDWRTIKDILSLFVTHGHGSPKRAPEPVKERKELTDKPLEEMTLEELEALAQHESGSEG